MKRSSRGQEHDENSARHAGHAFAGEHERKNHEELLRPAHGDARACATKIEAMAR